MRRPYITLLTLSSVDGKINMGSTTTEDMEEDLCRLNPRGLELYRGVQQNMPACSIVSGKTMEKMAWMSNYAADCSLPVIPVTLVVIDRHHLTRDGLKWLATRYQSVVIIVQTTQYMDVQKIASNVTVLYFTQCELLVDQLCDWAHTNGISEMCLETGGTLTSQFVSRRYIDEVILVMAPIIVGGQYTPTVCDGANGVAGIATYEGANNLQLLNVQQQGNYVMLHYKVVNAEELHYESGIY